MQVAEVRINKWPIKIKKVIAFEVGYQKAANLYEVEILARVGV